MDKQEIKNLKKRYLIWLYKTTKEALDKIERKFTQAGIDRFLLKEFRNKDNKLKKFIEEWETYIQNKEKDGLTLKFKNGGLRPEYQFLSLKLKAIKKAIRKELGKKTLPEIEEAYEKEIQRRILEERQERL